MSSKLNRSMSHSTTKVSLVQISLVQKSYSSEKSSTLTSQKPIWSSIRALENKDRSLMKISINKLRHARSREQCVLVPFLNLDNLVKMSWSG